MSTPDRETRILEMLEGLVSASPIVRAARMKMRHGCGDSSCEFRRPEPGAMHTNGGCRCWQVIESDFAFVQRHAAEQAERIAALTAELAEAHAMLTGKGAMLWVATHPDGPTTELGKAIEALAAQVDCLQNGLVDLQRHRDHWRGYAYGDRDKPKDFLDGNRVGQPPTKIEQQAQEIIRLEALASKK